MKRREFIRLDNYDENPSDEIPRFHNLDPGLRPQVERLIASNELNDSEKEDALKLMLTQADFQIYKEWKAEQTPEKRFLRLVPASEAERYNRLIEAEQFAALRTMFSEPHILEAINAIEVAQQSRSPEEKFLYLLSPGLKDICKQLLEKGNYKAIECLIKNERTSAQQKFAQLRTASEHSNSDEGIHSEFERFSMSSSARARNYEGNRNERHPSNGSSLLRSNRLDRSRSFHRLYDNQDDMGRRPINKRRFTSHDSFFIARETLCFLREVYDRLHHIEDSVQCSIDLSDGEEPQISISAANNENVDDAEYAIFILCCEQENFKFRDTISQLYSQPLQDWDHIEIFKKCGAICKEYRREIMILAHSTNALHDARRMVYERISRGRTQAPPRNQTMSLHQEYSDEDNDEDLSIIHNQTIDNIVSYPENMTILFLGETGAGKSTAINSLVNYLKYPTLEEAQNDFTVLIQSKFTVTEDVNNQINHRQIITKPTVDCKLKNNESEEIGKSSTQHPQCYKFHWKMDGFEKTITIIDTPGIGDTEGIKKDQENFANILKFIAGYDELNAICIMIKPDCSKLTPAFRFCIDELLVHLHKTAAQNIVFYFTCTRGTSYKPGETFATLTKHLEGLKKKRGISIPLNESTMFSFDNEAFKYLCGQKERVQYTDEQKRGFQKSYEHSVKETTRLLSRISHLPVHRTKETLCINNTRSMIVTLAKPLAEILRNQTINAKLIKERLEEIEKLRKEGADLRDKLYVEQEFIRAKEIDYPKTVCTAQKCVEIRQIGTFKNMTTIYKTVCHEHCNLEGVETETFPNVALQKCWAMNKEYNCKICQCSWQTHMHIRYELETVMQRVVQETVEKELNVNKNYQKAAQLFVDEWKVKLAELEKRSARVMKYSATFANFLNDNSIMPFSDSYLQYLEYIITQERAKATYSKDLSMVKELEEHKKEYEAQIQILSNSPSASAESIENIDGINKMIEDLHKMEDTEVLDQVKKLELLTEEKEKKERGVIVNMAHKAYDAGYSAYDMTKRAGKRLFKFFR